MTTTTLSQFSELLSQIETLALRAGVRRSDLNNGIDRALGHSAVSLPADLDCFRRWYDPLIWMWFVDRPSHDAGLPPASEPAMPAARVGNFAGAIPSIRVLDLNSIIAVDAENTEYLGYNIHEAIAACGFVSSWRQASVIPFAQSEFLEPIVYILSAPGQKSGWIAAWVDNDAQVLFLGRSMFDWIDRLSRAGGTDLALFPAEAAAIGASVLTKIRAELGAMNPHCTWLVDRDL